MYENFFNRGKPRFFFAKSYKKNTFLLLDIFICNNKRLLNIKNGRKKLS